MKRLEETPIWLDVKKIFEKARNDIRYEMTASIHTKDDDYKVYKVVSIDIVRDYTNNIGDDITIELRLPFGDYVKRLYPYRNNLELTLFRLPLSEYGDSVRKNKSRTSERFKAVFLPDQNPVVRASEFDNVDKFTLDISNLITVKLQLINRALEVLRIITVDGVFHNTANKDILRTLISEESKKLLIDGKPSIGGFDMVDPDNEEVQPQVLFPEGTLLSAVPTYLQERMGGLYTSGVGNYFQFYDKRTQWFVYPLYNTKRFDKEKGMKMVVYTIPRDRFPYVERTFLVNGNTLNVVATSDRKYADSAETDFMESGVGFRMSEARSFMRKFVKMTKEGPVGVRHLLNHEVGLREREDNLNYGPIADRDISANPFTQYSRIAAKDGGRINIVWQNADYQYLYPNMPIMVVYMEGDKVKKAKGVILFAHAYVELVSQGPDARTHQTTVYIVAQIQNQ